MIMNYKLVDTQGNMYLTKDQSIPPQCVVMHQGKPVFTGVFTFGKSGACQCSWKVPFYLNGELKIHAIQNLGGLGSDETEPVVYRIQSTYPALGAVPWLLLLGVVAWERRNKRNNRWLLAAMAMSFGLIWIFEKSLTFLPIPFAQDIAPFYFALLYGFCITCLRSSYVTSSQNGVAFLKKLLVLVSSSILAFLCLINSRDSSTLSINLLLLLVIGSGLLLSWVIASTVCQPLPRLILFNMVFGAIFFGLIISISAILFSAFIGDTLWIRVLLIASGLAAVLILILEPMILILFLHPSQKRRLTEMLQ